MIWYLIYLLFWNICFLILYRTWEIKNLNKLVEWYLLSLVMWWIVVIMYLWENIYKIDMLFQKKDISWKIFNFLNKKIW